MTTQLVSNSTGTVETSTSVAPDATLALPNTYGVGFTYNYDKRLTIGVDYSLQQWSKADFGVRTTDESIRGDLMKLMLIATVLKYLWVRNISLTCWDVLILLT